MSRHPTPDADVANKWDQVRAGDAGDKGRREYPCTDLGNAERMAAQFRSQLRYCHGLGRWLVWDGTRWKEDDQGAAMQFAARTARSILREAELCNDPKQRQALAAWAVESESRRSLEAMIALAKSQPELVVRPDSLDADPFLLNTKSGTIDLRSGQIRRHDHTDLITKLAPTTFHPEAKCPRFLEFLNRIFAGQVDVITYVQRWLGHCLTGDISEQYLAIYHGVGANGKSVLMDTVMGLMGEYACVAPPYLLTESKQREHPTEIADLRGRRLVVASETEEGSVLKLQLVKRLTGDETLKGRHMREDYFTFARTHKMVLMTNNKPCVKEDSESVWRRLRLVPFGVVIPEKERDKHLLKKLRNEWPGILAWLVAGCVDWQREGLAEPAVVVQATRRYRGAEDGLGRYVEERLDLDRNNPSCESGIFTPWSSIWTDYTDWSGRSGETPVNARTLGEALDKIGFPTGHGQFQGSKVKGRRGISLKNRGESGGPNP